MLSLQLRMQAVDFVMAPFEADAQMACLGVNGLVHADITEDSDMLPYSCPRSGSISESSVMSACTSPMTARQAHPCTT